MIIIIRPVEGYRDRGVGIMTSRRFESILMSLVTLNRETSNRYTQYQTNCEPAVQRAINKIEKFFCLDIKKYPSLPSESNWVQNWSIVLAYLNDANHTARTYEPKYPLDCEQEVDRAVSAVSAFFSIPLKELKRSQLWAFHSHKVCPETREDIVLSTSRKTKGS